jgi:hypothetical protein
MSTLDWVEFGAVTLSGVAALWLAVQLQRRRQHAHGIRDLDEPVPWSASGIRVLRRKPESSLPRLAALGARAAGAPAPDPVRAGTIAAASDGRPVASASDRAVPSDC